MKKVVDIILRIVFVLVVICLTEFEVKFPREVVSIQLSRTEQYRAKLEVEQNNTDSSI